MIRIRIRDSLKYPGQNGNKTCSGFFRGSQDFQIETNTVLTFGDFGCIPAFAGSHINIEYTIQKVPKFVVYISTTFCQPKLLDLLFNSFSRTNCTYVILISMLCV